MVEIAPHLEGSRRLRTGFDCVVGKILTGKTLQLGERKPR